MRKKIVVSGIIVLVVGVILVFYGLYVAAYAPFWLVRWDTTDTIASDEWVSFSFSGVESGEKVHCKYTASNEAFFRIFDESNYDKFEMLVTEGTFSEFQYIYNSVGESDSYIFTAPKDDTYYVVLSAENDVNVTVKILTERVWISYAIMGFGLVVLPFCGLVAIIAGYKY